MKIVERDGYWYSDDGSLISFGRSEPTHIEAAVVGENCLVRPSTEKIPLTELEYVRSVRCGVRGKPGSQWNCDTLYSVYVWKAEFARPVIVLAAGHLGIYCHFSVVHQLDGKITFDQMATLPESLQWDIINMVVGTRRKAYKDGREDKQREMTEAFIEGRLKKKKVRGQEQYTVTIEPRRRRLAS